MTPVEMMYVYFDEAGDIKTISPDPVDTTYGYSVSTFLLSDVECFCRGIKNPSDYRVKSSKHTTGVSYSIIRKHVLVVSHVRTLDKYLTEVGTMPTSSDAFVLIENIVNENKIRVSINPVLRSMLAEGTDEDQEAVTFLLGNATTSLFFTPKNDPYMLLHTFTFSPAELFALGEMYQQYTVDLTKTSVYTKKLIDKYSYIIRQPKGYNADGI